MKKKIFISLGLLILIIIIVIDKINFNPKYVDFNIEQKFYKGYFPESANRNYYSSTIKFENDKKIKFPRTTPKKIILFSNNNWIKNEYELNTEEINTLLKILNDSTKYKWGEIGTPEFNYYFKYFDDKNNLIGITKIDQIGMAYSEPYLTKMKWCQMKNINEVNNLIKKIKK